MDSDIIIRPATLADKEGILMYRGLFCNLDPMESERFEIYMNSKLRHKFVAEHNGVVVSFLGLVMVDGGRTAYYYGARTREGYTNRSIQYNLLKHAVNYVKERYPVERVWLSTWYTKFDDEYFKSCTEKRLILRKRMVCLSTETSRPIDPVRNWLEELDTSNIKQISPGQITDYIESPKLQPYFDNGVIFYDYYCCLPRKFNKDAFCELLVFAFVGFDKDGQANSLSTSGRFRAASGKLRFDMNFNAPDFNTTLTHAFLMIHHIWKTHPNEIVELFLHIDERVDPVQFEKAFIETKQELFKLGGVPRQFWWAKVIELLDVL